MMVVLNGLRMVGSEDTKTRVFTYLCPKETEQGEVSLLGRRYIVHLIIYVLEDLKDHEMAMANATLEVRDKQKINGEIPTLLT
jgi:hypothetical protein